MAEEWRAQLDFSVDARWDLLVPTSRAVRSWNLYEGISKAAGKKPMGVMLRLPPFRSTTKGGVCSLLPFWRSLNHFRGSRFTSDDSGVTAIFWSEISQWIAESGGWISSRFWCTWKWAGSHDEWTSRFGGLMHGAPMTSNSFQWGRPLLNPLNITVC